ncbi:MAG: DUF1289 domain-containing protein [Dechloromonas sp.]|nr:DUF1289 domain-containing protein [Dechloromonas sp.]
MITSPCTNICKMDASTGLCLGCFRTIDEITAWSRIDDSARARILADIHKRRGAPVQNFRPPTTNKDD